MHRNATGFTIVELLIVIVVVGVLAAISIVAYNSVQQKAAEAALKSDLRSASTQLETEYIQAGAYPVSSGSPPAIVHASAGITFTYTSDGQAYCLTAASARSGVSSHRVSNGEAIAEGVCPGHGDDGGSGSSTLVNMHDNPSIETTWLTNYGGANGSAIAHNTTRSHTGAASLRVTMPVASAGQVGTIMLQRDVGDFFQPNTTYTASAYVFVPAGTVDVQMNVQGSGRASATNPTERIATTKGSWVRIYNTFTTAPSGQVNIFVLNSAATTVASTQFWIDSAMITEGNQLHAYADGSFANWSWNGTEWRSASEGPIP